MVFVNAVVASDGTLIGITNEEPRRVFRSTDRGATWSIAFASPTSGFDFSGDMAAGPDRLIYVTLQSARDEESFRQVVMFRSRDAGENWEVVDETWKVSGISGIVVSSRGYVFLATQGRGVQGLFRSTDRGSSWSPTALTSSPTSNGGINPRSLAAGPDGLLLAMYGGGEASKNGLFLSRDDGDSWEEIERPAAFASISFGIDVRGNLVATGTTRELDETVDIFVSHDWGESWIPAGLNSLGFFDADFASTLGENLLVVSGYDGVFRTIDEGDTWTEENSGLPNEAGDALSVNVNQIFVDPDGYLYANTTGGLYRSTVPVE